MGFPTSVFSPTTKNNGDVVQASHINDLQTEITAIETAALSGSWTVPNQPRMHAVASGSQTISSSQSSGVRLAYGQIYHDIGSGWSTTTNQYTVPSSGTYLLQASVVLAGGNPDGSFGVYSNNSSVAFAFAYVSTLTPHTQELFMNTPLNTGDVIHFALSMNSTVSRATVGAQVSKVSIVKLC
jgi:hypothetical protein